MLKIVEREKRIPRTYKFLPRTINKLKEISSSQGKSMTTILEYLIDNFEDLTLKDEVGERRNTKTKAK